MLEFLKLSFRSSQISSTSVSYITSNIAILNTINIRSLTFGNTPYKSTRQTRLRIFLRARDYFFLKNMQTNTESRQVRWGMLMKDWVFWLKHKYFAINVNNWLNWLIKSILKFIFICTQMVNSNKVERNCRNPNDEYCFSERMKFLFCWS